MNSVWAVLRQWAGNEKVTALFTDEADAQAFCADSKQAEVHDRADYSVRVFQVRNSYREDAERG